MSTRIGLTGARNATVMRAGMLRETDDETRTALVLMTVLMIAVHGRYSASRLLRTPPLPSRLRPISRCLRLYGLPCYRRFRGGTRRASSVARHVLCHRAVTSTPPEWRTVSARLRSVMLSSPSHCELDLQSEISGPHPCSVALRPGDSLPSQRWPCRWASEIRFPSSLSSELQGSGSYLGGTDSR